VRVDTALARVDEAPCGHLRRLGGGAGASEDVSRPPFQLRDRDLHGRRLASRSGAVGAGGKAGSVAIAFSKRAHPHLERRALR
jgi:hypothetical protein